MLTMRRNIHLLFSVLAFFICQNLTAQSFPVLEWQKFFGGEEDEEATTLIKTKDGNLMIGGIVAEGGDERTSCTDMLMMKVTPNGQKLWERRFGVSGCDELRDMVETPDTGVIFVGVSSAFISHPEKGEQPYQGDYFVGKLDVKGDIEWIKTYGGLDMDQAYSITRSETWPEYIVAGASLSQNFDVATTLGMTNFWGLKIDEMGDQRTGWAFGGNRHDWAYAIDGTRDGDYVFAGFTNSEDIDGTARRTNGDGWVGRIDRYGAVRWQRIYSGKFEDYFTDIFEDEDGRLIVCGNFESETRGKQFWFLKLTASGKKIYEKIFGDEDVDEFALDIEPCESGGYIITGYSKAIALKNKYIKGGEDFWVVRLDDKGRIMWSDTYGGRADERGAAIVEYSPGVFYALGTKRNDFILGGIKDNKKDFWLLKISEENCDDIDIDVYLSLKDYTAYVDKNFKLKANVPGAVGYKWDFGDGTTSNLKEPVKKYEIPGVYEVKVTVYLNENCSKTQSLPEFIMVW